MTNRKKPKFFRQDLNKAKRVRRSSWRKPKGLQSKLRAQFRGRAKMPSTGYGSPKEFKKKIVTISHKKQLETFNKPDQNTIVKISGKIGGKNKKELYQLAAQLFSKKQIQKNEDLMKKRKDSRKKLLERKKGNYIFTKVDKKEEKKEQVKETSTPEEQKEAERRESEKVITKRM